MGEMIGAFRFHWKEKMCEAQRDMKSKDVSGGSSILDSVHLLCFFEVKQTEIRRIKCRRMSGETV